MVAKVRFGSTPRRAFYYNEKKVQMGAAEFIHSANYGKDTDQLTRKDRLARLTKQAAFNERSNLKGLHISLNFQTGETISKESLRGIVDSYMQQIGLGGQPYLVYQHTDVVHPHVHIVTTGIRSDGSRIDVYMNVRHRSGPARQAIEKEFGLHGVREGHFRPGAPTQPVLPASVQHSKVGTCRAISDVLDVVLPKATYTTLAEFKTILREFNVMVDEGKENSRLRKRGGLIYRIIDNQGEGAGVGIKASDFRSKPTLKHLQKRFAENLALRETPATAAIRETPGTTPDVRSPAPKENFTPKEVITPKENLTLKENLPPKEDPTPKEDLTPRENPGLEKERHRKRKRLHL